MSVDSLTVIIPALKKNVAFPDDLVKKLAGKTLVQRAIEKAQGLGAVNRNIHLLTDSEEIQLIAERNDVSAYLEAGLAWDVRFLRRGLYRYLLKASRRSNITLLLSPYAPLISIELLKQAIEVFKQSKNDVLKPIKVVQRQLYDSNRKSALGAIFGISQETHKVESKAFALMKSHVISTGRNSLPKILLWEVERDLLEIESFQDWWVCEKLIQSKRIVFRVVGNEKDGMGHIYRALSLAHEITDHEIIFVSDTNNTMAVKKLAGYDYWVEIYEPTEVVQKIIDLKPDLVINDILSTSKEYISLLHDEGIKVVNFEDLGEGALLADLTINELYDEPIIHGENIRWGHGYYFLRDEFYDARTHDFSKKVDNILVAFGGTDQHNMSHRVYTIVKDICEEMDVHINIVTGAGYRRYDELLSEVEGNPNVTLTRETGVISKVMERTQVGIVSNGRTVYELAHMNIPAIVIPQHEREKTHCFAVQKNGFIPLSYFEYEGLAEDLRNVLKRLLDEEKYRHDLYRKTLQFRFDNKLLVIQEILDVIEAGKSRV